LADAITVFIAALVGGAVGGIVGGVVGARASRGSRASSELPPVDPKTVAALVAQNLESMLNDIVNSIGAIGEKMANIEESVNTLYNLFAAYLGAAAAYRTGRRRRVQQASEKK